MMPDAADRPLVRSFGRKGGRPLSQRQKTLLAERLHLWEVPAGDAPIDPEVLFPGTQDIWLEIGFGGAEHLIAQAARHPQAGLIGCEPFIEGVAKAVAGIEDAGLTNVRLWPDDARLLLTRLPEASLARVFILFPDPWPKRRQQKRRLVQPDFLRLLRSRMQPGARVRFATDVRSYADEALLAFLSAGGFEWTATVARDWQAAPEDHVTTRYESKQLGDCQPVWIECVSA
ncbi:tRNA (guanosine(46)-N7)-methyltransferase TrmB [Hyphomonas sp.]|uniref:tRNA (guanosine(46)-N7)-methyltransferase TrmB n=1 Tax=Hyphomonas sp. TaxID=87 RepID=UPI00391B9E80